ncbi:DUF3709 domain-containing protein [Vibrio cholerae]|uniref:DUF3709 domain-containing protein n=1 Tax=Vibrio cholerae TaxID=666 RepID=UPI0012AED9C9|nr:DUF3709 domain-containing protein [Vibrio cholerae]EJL6630046.1 DUF3709 domain-containing protein [Vibrio cholerae]EJL6742573.1 DUF3709 domain-containing protein [Vibrio cholerae]
MSYCLIGLLSLREVSFALSSRFKFQRHCLIELFFLCVVSWFVGEGFNIGLVAK